MKKKAFESDLPLDPRAYDGLCGDGDYLRNLGITTLTHDVAVQVKDAFKKHVSAALDPKSDKKSSLKMFNSRIGKDVLAKEIKPCSQALVIDMGGSELKFGIVTADSENKPKIQGQVNETTFPKTQWRVEELFDWISDQIKTSGIDISQISSIGLIFSFPAEPLETNRGIDVKSQDDLPKGWKIEEISIK